MKAVKAALFFMLLGMFDVVYAQSDSAIASQRAMMFADSLLNAYRYKNWQQYVELSYPGVIKYYGGKKGFEDYVHRARSMNNAINEEQREKLEIIQLMNDISEWQCVVRKTRFTMIDGKRARVVSYMVGQSKDDGMNWKYFDVAFNSVENVIYIMPDIFDTLAIPERQIIFDKSETARY